MKKGSAAMPKMPKHVKVMKPMHPKMHGSMMKGGKKGGK
jgi:hypothetical protein